MSGTREGDVTILITSSEEIQALNRDHRGVDESTDVLTFPAPEFPAGELGDIAIDVAFIERGAKERRVALSHEASYLAIHGALHLAGMDDQTEAEFRLMQKAMNDAALKAGIPADLEWTSLPHGSDG